MRRRWTNGRHETSAGRALGARTFCPTIPTARDDAVDNDLCWKKTQKTCDGLTRRVHGGSPCVVKFVRFKKKVPFEKGDRPKYWRQESSLILTFLSTRADTAFCHLLSLPSSSSSSETVRRVRGWVCELQKSRFNDFIRVRNRSKLTQEKLNG